MLRDKADGFLLHGLGNPHTGIGDYRESWQPYKISDEALKQAQYMADKVTKALTGAGIWGVEFFLTKQGEVIFSELSPDMLVFFVVGSQATITHFFQSIGKVKVSIFLSLSRQLFLLLPMAYVFPLFWELDGVWYSMPVSDFLSFAMTIPMLMWYMKKFKANEK